MGEKSDFEVTFEATFEACFCVTYVDNPYTKEVKHEKRFDPIGFECSEN